MDSEKVMIFIDGSNLYHGVDRYCRMNGDPRFRIDYEKLIAELVSGRRLIRAYYYGSRPAEPREEQEKFFKALQHSGITVEVLTLKERDVPIYDQNGNQITNQDGTKATRKKKLEKGVDVALVTGLLSFGFRKVYDTAIVVGGDQDFMGAINELKHAGKRVEVATFDNSVGEEMSRCADKLISLDKLITKIRMA